MSLPKIFGRNIARYRHQQGLSQEELAERANIHRTYISDLERGARNPTLEVVDKVARGLKISPDKLLKTPDHSE